MAQRRRRYDPKRDDRRRRELVQKQDQIINRVPKHVTVFGILLILDLFFSFEPMVLLVDNMCDKKPDGTDDADGKPSGIGATGGGLEHPDEYENPNKGLRREILEETGLWSRLCNIFRYSYAVGKLIYKGKGRKTGQKSSDEFEYGTRPRIRRSPHLWDLECFNPVFFSLALPHWEGSPHQKIFRELARRKTDGQINSKGLFFDFNYEGPDKLDITPQKLGITADGQSEIQGLYLLPLTRVKEWFADAPHKRGERGYTYFKHFDTISWHGNAIVTWYHWLETRLLEEGEAAIQAAPYMQAEHIESMTEAIRQAMQPLAGPVSGSYYNLPRLVETITGFCEATGTPNPLEKLQFQDWFREIKERYCLATGIPPRMAVPDEIMKWYKKIEAAA